MLIRTYPCLYFLGKHLACLLSQIFLDNPSPFENVKVGAFLISGMGNISSDISSSTMQYVPQVYSRRVACLDTPYCCDIDCYITQTFCATILGTINRCVPRVN